MKTPKLWQKFILAVGGLFLFEAGARIALPGLDAGVLNSFVRSQGGGGLLGLYDRLGGGALSRGGLLAIGIIPYLSARVFVRLFRVVSPAAEAMAHTEAGRRRLTWWTRGLTVGLAAVQSFGLAQFAQRVPGAVAHPGLAFTVQSMLALVGGSVLMMLLSEQISRTEDDEPSEVPPAVLEAGMGEILDPAIHGREKVSDPVG